MPTPNLHETVTQLEKLAAIYNDDPLLKVILHVYRDMKEVKRAGARSDEAIRVLAKELDKLREVQ